jgi:hypothetical protein
MKEFCFYTFYKSHTHNIKLKFEIINFSFSKYQILICQIKRKGNETTKKLPGISSQYEGTFKAKVWSLLIKVVRIILRGIRTNEKP